jgi:hypothetical protein
MQTGAQLWALFVTILTHGNPEDPGGLWTTYKKNICNDCVLILKRRGFENPDEEHVESLALHLWLTSLPNLAKPSTILTFHVL